MKKIKEEYEISSLESSYNEIVTDKLLFEKELSVLSKKGTRTIPNKIIVSY